MAEFDNVKVLIADDEPISRKLLHKLLSKHVKGDIDIAEDGSRAWEIAKKKKTHLLIADWMMPGMDGLQLCRKFREAKFDHYTYIILLTARDQQDDVLEGLNAGADDYICKPFDPNELRLRINAGLRIIRLEEELAKKNSQLKTLNKKLEELARIDPVMDIGNRNSFYEVIEQLHNQAIRYNKGYGLLIADVDYFKLYNDTQGHQAGDKILRNVAQTIKNNIRPSDQAFRYGGEEIVVLLPEQDLTGAINSGRRLCQAVREMQEYHPHGVNNLLTISIGAASCAPGKTACPDWKEVLEHADEALYYAKEQGKDRVCSTRDTSKDQAAAT